jgi:DNA-binding GntR family transcriptional regulator
VPALDDAAISELYDVRAAIESLMAREACAKATASDIEVLRSILELNTATVAFAEEAMKHGEALHMAIARIAGNSWARRFHDQVSSHMQRYRHYTNNTQERRDQALADHRILVEAVASGKPEEAARIAFEHVIGARDEALRAISGGTPADK